MILGMKKKINILIAGGAGFIGAQVNQLLHDSGYNTIVIDNLCTGCRDAVTAGSFIEGNIADEDILDTIFEQQSIDAVMHFAAHLNIAESFQLPGKYYTNNVGSTLKLLASMQKYSVNRLIFSSSAAIFGMPQYPKINEEHPQQPISPYGKSKWMIEQILRDYDEAYGLKSCSLRYFNAAGGDPLGRICNQKGDDFNLIPTLLRSLKDKGREVTLFGTDYPTPDGTCVRDYIHVYDIAKAHLIALEQLFEHNTSTAYNLGHGEGFSIRHVINAIEAVTKQQLQVIEGPRRRGDPAILIADPSKAEKELGWRRQYSDLETMIAHAWKALT